MNGERTSKPYLSQSPRNAWLALAPEGRFHIGAALVLALALGGLWGVGGGLLGLMVLAIVVNFFRDPERVPPNDPQGIVAPADGKVIQVANVDDVRFFPPRATRISIFMSPLDVHVNRIPWKGRVLDVRYYPGKYFRAFAEKASFVNEQNAVLIQDDHGRQLCCVQIAGFIARRIVCRVQAGDRVERGQRYGIILFGSRVDVYFPAGSVEVVVETGQRTRAGETVVARWR